MVCGEIPLFSALTSSFFFSQLVCELLRDHRLYVLSLYFTQIVKLGNS